MAGPSDISSDVTLVMAARAGDQSAYSRLLEAHRGAVFRICRNHVGEDAEALDLTQETFATAFVALASFDTTRPFRNWILRIAVNKCHDWARRRTVRHFFTFARPIEDALDLADQAASPEDDLASRQEIEQLRKAIAALPSGIKEPLILCTIEGMSHAAAAQILRLSEKAIETRIYRAKRRLAEILEA